MNLTEHFTEAEFTASDYAARNHIDNRLPPALRAAAVQTCEMMERIRAHLTAQAGKPIPILITSGYRCLGVNRGIGSGDRSDHVSALAIDFKAPAFGTPLQVCHALAPHVAKLGIGQLILEFRAWAHVSPRMRANAVNRILTIDSTGTHVGLAP